MEEKFDIKALQSRIAEVKKETEEVTEFALQFFECLIKRHDLPNILHEDHEFDDTPDEVTEALKKGEVPKKEDLVKMKNAQSRMHRIGFEKQNLTRSCKVCRR